MSRASNFCRPEIRAAIHERDGYRCAYCGAEQNLTLDHLTPTSRGGTHHYTNLVTACRSCNSSKQGQTLLEYVISSGRDRSVYDEVRRKAKRRITKILARIRFEARVEREVRRRLADLADPIPF